MATISSEIEKKYEIHVKEHSGKLIQHLNSARKERRLCDVLIKVGSEEIHAHRIILSEGCDYYRGMFTHEMKESASGVVEMKDVDPECMSICIEYIYTGKVSVRESKVHPLLQIAQMLQLTGLVDALIAFLDQHLDAESFFVTRDLANNFGLTELQKKCEQYGEQNFEAISKQEGFQRIDKKSLISLVTSEGNKAPEGIKVKSIFCWIKSEPEARKKCLRELHKHIDFAKVPVEYRRKLIEDEPLVYSCSELMQQISISVMDTANIQSSDVGAVGGTTVQKPNITVPFPTQTDKKLCVDKDIFAFTQLVQAQDLQKIWDSNGVKINVTTVGDASNVEFLPKHSTLASRLNDAMDQFQRIYISANDTACQEMYDLGRFRESPSDQKVEEVLSLVRIIFKNVHVVRMFEDKQQVLFVAKTKQACDAAMKLFCESLRGDFQ